LGDESYFPTGGWWEETQTHKMIGLKVSDLNKELLKKQESLEQVHINEGNQFITANNIKRLLKDIFIGLNANKDNVEKK
jgi:hypothetical protein